MNWTSHNAVLMFIGLVTLYSPIAALPSYVPTVSGFTPKEQGRLAAGLFLYVSIFVLAALWAGELLLEVLGISTAALTATGGIALILEAVPLMRGQHELEAGAPDDVDLQAEAAPASTAEPSTTVERPTIGSVLLTPLAFPLTVGGATFAVLVGFAATVDNVGDRFLLTAAGLAYAAVTGMTLYLSGHVQRRASPRATLLLDSWQPRNATCPASCAAPTPPRRRSRRWS
jgi:multiple antibiotic resistance protein